MRAPLSLSLLLVASLAACAEAKRSTPTTPRLWSPPTAGARAEEVAIVSARDRVAEGEFLDGSSAPSGTAAPTASASEVSERKVLHNADIGIKAKDVPAALRQVEEIAKKHGGFVLNSNKDGEGTQFSVESAVLSLRIPDAKLSAALDDIGSLGRVTRRNITGQDVTDQYTDLKIRLESKERLLARYRELLTQATNVRDMLDIEAQIGRVTEEIETYKGSLVYLDDRLMFSTVSVSIQKRRVPGPLGAIFYGIGWGVSKLFLIK